MAYTRSVAKVLADLGLMTVEAAANLSRNKNITFNKEGEGWTQNQNKKSRAPRPAAQLSTFELATRNMFAPLQENY